MCINLKKYLNNSDDFSLSFINKNNSFHNKLPNNFGYSKIKINLISNYANKNLPFINNHRNNKTNLDIKKISINNKFLNEQSTKNILSKSLSQRNFQRIQLFQSPKKINEENNQFFKKIKKYKLENSFQQRINNLLYKFDDNYMCQLKKLKDNKNIINDENFDISDYHKKFIDISKDKIHIKNLKILKNNLENINEKIKYNKKIFQNKWDIFYNKIEHIAPFNLLKKIKSLSNKKRKCVK